MTLSPSVNAAGGEVDLVFIRHTDDDEEVDEEDEGGHAEPEVTIEISGLSLFTHVGVTAAEREVGQRLLVDIRLDVGECDATVTDRIEDTVDYGEVCDTVNLVAAHLSARGGRLDDQRIETL